MRITKFFGLMALLGGFVSLGSVSGRAQTAEQVVAAKEILTKVPAAQLAAKSAELVASAPAKERAAVAAAVGQSVAKINPDLAPVVVAAICLKTPTVAPAAAAAAALVLPDSAAAIAVATAKVPGVKVNEVRSAVIAAVPSKAAEIVLALVHARVNASLDAFPRRPAGTAINGAPLTGPRRSFRV